MRLEPRLLIWSSTRACAPAPTATIVMTAATPMMMPSIVSAERSLLMRSAASAMRSVARKFMARPPPPAAATRRAIAAASSGAFGASTIRRPSRKVSSRDAKAAMSCSCVTTTMVMPLRLSSCSSAMISTLVVESSAPVGSSARISLGSLTSARAIATRCCWPPESCDG